MIKFPLDINRLKVMNQSTSCPECRAVINVKDLKPVYLNYTVPDDKEIGLQLRNSKAELKKLKQQLQTKTVENERLAHKYTALKLKLEQVSNRQCLKLSPTRKITTRSKQIKVSI